MRIGFYVGAVQAKEIGGGFTFQNSVLSELFQYSSHHDILILYKGENIDTASSQTVHLVNLQPYIEEEKKEKRKRRRTTLIKFFNKIFIKKQKRNSTFLANKNFLQRSVEEHNIDVVYFIHPSFVPVTIPYIATVWDLAHKKTPYFPEVSVTEWTFEQRENNYQPLLSKASGVVIGNNEGKRQVAQYYNIEPDLIHTNPMPTPDYVYTMSEDKTILEKNDLEKDKYLFYPAQFWAHKNHIVLLKALQKLKNQGHNFKLALTGSDQGNLAFIKAKISAMDLKNDVKLLGFVSRNELIALYKNAYALTFASYMGPDNIPPLEAFALKCPVICANTYGMQEQLKDAALFFNPKSEDSLIQQVIEIEKHKETLIPKGEALAKEYCIQNYVQNIFKIVDELQPIIDCWR